MYGVLELMSYPRTDDCVVNVSAGRPFEVSGDDSNDRPSGKKGSGKMSMKDKKGSDKGSGKMSTKDKKGSKKGSGKMSIKDEKESKKGSGKMSVKGKQMTRRALGHERRLFANAPRGVVRGSKS